MSKLQLYITKSGNVFKSLLNLNPHEEIRRHVGDLREAVTKIDYDAREKNIFYMVSATDSGMFFNILRTIPTVAGHHLAAWIFIPAQLQISARELLDIVSFTTRKVSGAEVTNDDVAALRELFGKEYPVDPKAPAITGCQGTEYAWRTYGEGTGLSLIDFTGRGRWQQSQIPYAGVVLLEDDLGYRMDAPSLENVPLGEAATIFPPEKTQENFSAHIFNRLLDRPMRGTLGAKLTVTWRRPGFEDVTVDETIDSREFVPEPVETANSRKTITPASFFVSSQVTREPLTDCTIRVNGRDINAHGRQFTSDELRHANVSVSCEGYFPFSGQLDLASTARALIQLQERRKIYRFELPLVSSDYGAPVKFELQTKKPVTESPVEGYLLTDDIQEGATRTNYLGYAGPKTTLSTKLIYAGVGLVAGILLMLLCGTCSRSGSESRLAPAANPDSIVANPMPTVPAPQTAPVQEPVRDDSRAQEEPKAEAPKAETASSGAATAQNTADAVRYLDDNKVWTKEKLDENPATKGLYDDLNSFNADRIINHWGPALSGSKKMQLVVKHVTQGKQKGKAKLPSLFNSADDHTITVQNYLNKVDP